MKRDQKSTGWKLAKKPVSGNVGAYILLKRKIRSVSEIMKHFVTKYKQLIVKH
jgi:hypothetical protein